MNYPYQLHEGTYKVQAGFKSQIGLIVCPYIPYKIQVANTKNLKILDGAQVYWSELRRFNVNRKSSKRQEVIIQAVVVGVKYCPYICEGINILCSIFSEQGNIGQHSKLYARPINPKIPIIELHSHQFPSISEEQIISYDLTFYYWAKIISWNYEEQCPQGVVTAVFNKMKTAESQAEAILYSMEINQNQCRLKVELGDFQDNLPINGHIPFEQTIFTIDPKQCDDMEDALSVKIINSAQKIYEIGVHISDVSSFMQYVDRREICKRGCTIYLPQKKISLFPQEITELCRFKAKAKRLAFSVFMTMNEEGEIFQTRFQKSIVTNAATLNYQEAQDILDNDGLQEQLIVNHELEPQEAQRIYDNLSILRKIALNRRRIRKQEQVLDRKQITFELDHNKMPVQIGIKKRYESQRIVEELMIATNGQVARKLVKDFGSNSLVIYHPQPSQYSIDNFNSFLSDFGIRFDSESIHSLQSEIRKIFEKQGIKDEFKQALVMRAIQMQELATYTKHMNSEQGHYGLNMEYYTHFTSPLRRFADVIVHEQLIQCLNIDCSTKPPINRNLNQEIQILNKTRITSKRLKQNIIEGFLNLFLHEKKQRISGKALIMSLGKKSATIYIPLYNLIKEVFWNTEVISNQRDTIKVMYSENGKTFWKKLHKNDSLDIEIQAAIHQQVSIKMFIRNEKSELVHV